MYRHFYLLIYFLNKTYLLAIVSMKNMEKILLICWMECSLSCFLTHATKVSLQLGTLLVLHPFTWAGVLMVRNFCIGVFTSCFFISVHCTSLMEPFGMILI